MALKDYYQILNCKPSDSQRRIYRNFRKLILELTDRYDHFKNPDFQLINEAYFILADETYRKLYDPEYKRVFRQDSKESLNQEQAEMLDIYIKRCQAIAYEVSVISFQEYSEQYLKRKSWVLSILELLGLGLGT